MLKRVQKSCVMKYNFIWQFKLFPNIISVCVLRCLILLSGSVLNAVIRKVVRIINYGSNADKYNIKKNYLFI